jgi:hypothetical protein
MDQNSFEVVFLKQEGDQCMAKFLATTGTNCQREELIKGATERLIPTNPFYKLNDRFKEQPEQVNLF